MTYGQLLKTIAIEDSDIININDHPVSWLELRQPTKNYILIYDQENTYSGLKSEYQLCAGSKKLIVSEIDLREIPYLLKNTFFTFYKDTLIQIEVNDFDPRLSELIKTKYGSGTLRTQSKTSLCSNRLGGLSTEEEYSYTTTWIGKPGITAKYWMAKWLTEKCEARHASEFTISIDKKMDRLTFCSNKQKQKEDEAEKKRKLKQLKDF